MTPEAQIENIAAQYRACKRGAASVIICPYCGGENRETNKALCCKLFAKATAAIMHREEVQAQLDQACRIADMVARN